MNVLHCTKFRTVGTAAYRPRCAFPVEWMFLPVRDLTGSVIKQVAEA